MDFDNMDENCRQFFDLILNALYNKFNTKEDIQDFILTLSNRIEENDYQDIEVDEEYEITITDGLQVRSDERDDDDDDLDEENNEVEIDKDGFYSLK
tara:strand:+ start:4716 stop:5006 length:291 start_codon:yes stop_codon:yes gene_type:complete